MSTIGPEGPDGQRIEDEAAAWILRTDRGLSAAEQDALSQWLAADRRHGACLARHRRNWDRLDALALWGPEHGPLPNPDLLAPPSRRRPAKILAFGLAAAAAAAAVLIWPARPQPAAAPPVLLAAIEERMLEDGSVIQLNRGAEVSVLYTPDVRRVRLERGEAHFTVAHNPARPFIVSAGGVDVRAVGTAFDVRLGAADVAVLVTEGRVRVDPPAGRAVSAPSASSLEAGQRELISLAASAPSPRITQVSPVQMREMLLWQPRMLDFSREPLDGIVAEFNRRNPVRIVVADSRLGAVRISASMRSDNVEGFVRLLEAGFGVRVEREGDTLTLRRGR